MALNSVIITTRMNEMLIGSGGRRHPHVSTIYRWRLRGIRGVKLETFLIGGRRYTSVEAIERFTERIPRLIRAITKSGDDALVLSQILYWFDHGKDGRPRARKFVEGERYVYKTHVELGGELGIPPGRIKDSLKRLRQAGFIETKYKLAKGGRTSHVRPLIPSIAAAMTKALIDLPPVRHNEQERDQTD